MIKSNILSQNLLVDFFFKGERERVSSPSPRRGAILSLVIICTAYDQGLRQQDGCHELLGTVVCHMTGHSSLSPIHGLLCEFEHAVFDRT